MPPLQRQVSSIDSYNYLLFLPDWVHVDGGDIYDGLRLRDQIQQLFLPTILFLHGAGQRGSNLDDVKKYGVPKIVEQWAIFFLLSFHPNLCAVNIGM